MLSPSKIEPSYIENLLLSSKKLRNQIENEIYHNSDDPNYFRITSHPSKYENQSISNQNINKTDIFYNRDFVKTIEMSTNDNIPLKNLNEFGLETVYLQDQNLKFKEKNKQSAYLKNDNNDYIKAGNNNSNSPLKSNLKQNKSSKSSVRFSNSSSKLSNSIYLEVGEENDSIPAQHIKDIERKMNHLDNFIQKINQKVEGINFYRENERKNLNEGYLEERINKLEREVIQLKKIIALEKY